MGSTTTPNLQVLDFMTMCELVDYSFCTKVIRVSCTTLGAVVRLSGSLQCRNVTDSCDDYSAIELPGNPLAPPRRLLPAAILPVDPVVMTMQPVRSGHGTQASSAISR